MLRSFSTVPHPRDPSHCDSVTNLAIVRNHKANACVLDPCERVVLPAAPLGGVVLTYRLRTVIAHITHVHRHLWSRKWKNFVYNAAVLFRLLMIHVHENFPRCPVCTHWRVIQDKLIKNLYTKIWFCFQNNVLRCTVIKNGNSKDRRDGSFSRGPRFSS